MLSDERKLELDRGAYALRQEIFEHRQSFWPDRQPQGLEVADPALAAEVLGVKFQYQQQIAFKMTRASSEVAGLLDRKKGLIVVAERFGIEVTRFTGAHEIGHWVFHETECTLHRDLPIGGLEQGPPDPVEREANHFAACFLMPRKYVADQFKLRFPSDGPFVVDDAAVHHFRIHASDSLLYPEVGSLVREKIFARAQSYGGRPFVSMVALFRVSVETMAIRIRELGLIRN